MRRNLQLNYDIIVEFFFQRFIKQRKRQKKSRKQRSATIKCKLDKTVLGTQSIKAPKNKLNRETFQKYPHSDWIFSSCVVQRYNNQHPVHSNNKIAALITKPQPRACRTTLRLRWNQREKKILFALRISKFARRTTDSGSVARKTFPWKFPFMTFSEKAFVSQSCLAYHTLFNFFEKKT